MGCARAMHRGQPRPEGLRTLRRLCGRHLHATEVAKAASPCFHATPSCAESDHSGPKMLAIASSDPRCQLDTEWRASSVEAPVRHHVALRQVMTSAAGLSLGALAKCPSQPHTLRPPCLDFAENRSCRTDEPRYGTLGRIRPESPTSLDFRKFWCCRISRSLETSDTRGGCGPRVR